MVKVTKKLIKKYKNEKLKKTEAIQRTLGNLKKKSEEKNTSILAKKHNLPYVDLNAFPFDTEVIKNIPKEDSLKYKVAMIQKFDRRVKVVITDPNDEETQNYIKQLEKDNGWQIDTYLVSKSSIETVWQKYADGFLMQSLDELYVSLLGDDLDAFEKNFKELLELKDHMDDMSTSRIIEIIFSGAIKLGASDVHFEPQTKSARIRYRIDGVLQDIGFFPPKIYSSMVSRIKMLGKMKLNIRDIAQDGHFSIEINTGEKKRRIDIRASAIPGRYGESVVMRLLDQSSIMIDVEDLGLTGLAHERVQMQISKPNGMVLVTGPTGSGKTTSLYAFINKLNTPDTKIITIEDPIEYEIKGISQTQVDNKRGYSFAKGLRAIVRQDPDIVLIGEVRDDETADIAINAALTGHLVLSTLHTNNAPASVARLIELGARPSLIASSVNIFIAQRLVRKLCPHCREKYEPAPETINTIKKLISIISPKSKVNIPKDIKYLYKPVGCPKCHNLGYKGRIGVFETMIVNEEIEKLILDMSGESKLTRAALEGGMITMLQDGILKVLTGNTSMEEVWRVTGQATFLENVYETLMDQTLSRAINISTEQLEETNNNINTFAKFSESLEKTASKNIAEAIIAGAVLLQVGDIHIEPEEKVFRIRYRIDGILQDIASLPLNEYPAFLGRIKMVCGLKTGVKSGVQDSRFKIDLEKLLPGMKDKSIDVRVSIISGGYGETIVMRLLNKSAVALDIDKLGIRKQNMSKILKAIKKPNGIVFNTGPTGSGKSTTLYSLLVILNKPEVKIITVEDPIEYRLPGILQTQVNEKDEYTFSSALRSLLRQNPDIVMIGEVRDEETAKTSIQASLTGHLILSTLHTNDASSAVQRLLNMGVDPENLATAVNIFMAQRLVRKLCDCKKQRQMTAEEKEVVEKILAEISSNAGIDIEKFKNVDIVYEKNGCEKCSQIGYSGRTVVSEVLEVNKEIEFLIARGGLASEVKDGAINNGMITMHQDGILKILEGATTFTEVNRVTGEE